MLNLRSERDGIRPVSSIRVLLLYTLLIAVSLISTLISIRDLHYSILSMAMGGMAVLIPSLFVIHMLLSRYKRDFLHLNEKKCQIEKLYMVLNQVNTHKKWSF